MDKIYDSAASAVADIVDGASIAVGGFGMVGVPSVLVDALLGGGATDLTTVSNNCGLPGKGLALLLEAGRLSRVVISYIGDNHELARRFLAGETEVRLIPQGTLAEKLRAGGAGIPAFYTPTGVGTLVAEGGIPQRYGVDGSVISASAAKEVRSFSGRDYVLETAIRTDFALVRAALADTDGNAVFHASARNFNPAAAMAGKVTIVEAEQVVDAGEIPPDGVHLPGIFVDRVVRLTPDQAVDKFIEKRTLRVRRDSEVG